MKVKSQPVKILNEFKEEPLHQLTGGKTFNTIKDEWEAAGSSADYHFYYSQ